MADNFLRIDPVLGYAAGPAPADMLEGLSTDGTPLVLQHEQTLASLPSPTQDFDWSPLLAAFHGALSDAVPLLQWFFLLYFIVWNGSYILLNLVSLFDLLRYRREQAVDALVEEGARHEIPISIIVPLCKPAASCAVAAVRAMLHLEYAEFEIIIVNDGCDEDALEALVREFSLAPFPESYRDRLHTAQLKSILASTAYPNLRLIDKEYGGRADALNAGINCARYPLYCHMDVNFALQRDSLRKMARVFVDHPATVGAYSDVRIADELDKPPLARNMLVLFQVIESLRGFLPGRAWWSDGNAMLMLPGAFAVLRKESVVAAGAYRSDVEDEGMELTVRLHRQLSQASEAYRIVLVPDPVCRKAAMGTMAALRSRHERQQRGLYDSLEMNRKLLFSPGGGYVGNVAFPFVLLFELLGPLIEVSGYVAMTAFWLAGAISFQAYAAFMLLAIGLGISLSVSGLVRDEIMFHAERKFCRVLLLFAAALLENFGYRQMTSVWRLRGLRRRTLRNESK